MSDVFSEPNRKDGYGKSKADAFDFFHINSVDKMESGDYLISARYMHAVVCISGKTGEILWQLGGKNNNFHDLGGALDFSWQHHVTWQGNDTISLFDNHANDVRHNPSLYSSGRIIKLDMEKMTAELVGKYAHPDRILNVSQGSVQVVNETGNVLVGFGNSPTYVEFAPDGEVLCEAHFAPHITFELVDLGLAKSYRIFKHPWVGRPKTVPDVKVKSGRIYVSWNGATEVAGWRLETAKMTEDTDGYVNVQEIKKEGFESSFELDQTHEFVRVVALDANMKAMAASATVSTVDAVSLFALPLSLMHADTRQISVSFWSLFWAMVVFALAAGSMSFFLMVWKHKRFSGLPLLAVQEGHVRLSAMRVPSLRDIKLRWLRDDRRGVVCDYVGDEYFDEERSSPLLMEERRDSFEGWDGMEEGRCTEGRIRL